MFTCDHCSNEVETGMKSDSLNLCDDCVAEALKSPNALIKAEIRSQLYLFLLPALRARQAQRKQWYLIQIAQVLGFKVDDLDQGKAP